MRLLLMGMRAAEITTAEDPGIEQTEDAAKLFFSLYESYVKASTDEKIDWVDIQYLFAAGDAASSCLYRGK